MTNDKAIEIEFHSEQLKEARRKAIEDPENSELCDLVRHLEASLTELESSDHSPRGVTEEAEALTVVGRTCEAFFDGKWFNAEILLLRVDEKGIARAIVKLMGTEQAREYDLKDLRLLPSASVDSFPEGKRVQAIWVEDGLWYNATITGLSSTKQEFLLAFDGFEGEPSPVKLDQIREPIIVPKQEKSKDVKTYTTPGGYVIPEKLRIDKKKDSEEVIADKKRKAHHLKSQQRTEMHNEKATAGKQKWQQFQQKIVRR
jgi:hypothetical protein